MHILLLTCAVSRAIHLEVCESLSLSDFLLAFRRFVSRRGFPKLVVSDNAQTFVGASRFLDSVSYTILQDPLFIQNRVQKLFNAPPGGEGGLKGL